MLRPGVAIPANELRWRFSRSSGPGGQSVNTSASRVSLSFDVARSPSLTPLLRARALERLAPRLVDGVMTVDAQNERSQHLNRIAAQDRLTRLLRNAISPPPRKRRATSPSAGAVQRRINAKKQRSRTKQLRRPTRDD